MFTYGTVCSGTTYRPQCYGDVTTGSAWDRGDILTYGNNDQYTYVVGDAHRSYNSNKCTIAERSMVIFKDDKDIVIVDHISTTDNKPNLTKKWVMHTMDYPVVSGTLEIDNRNNYGGGIIEFSDPSMIKVTDIPKDITSPGVTTKHHPGGNGKLFIVPILPKQRKVVLTGGPSSTNEHYTNDSFEFYYNGRQHRQYRHDDTPEMGTWRIEISPINDDIGKDNIFMNVIHVTDSDSDVPDVEEMNVVSNNMVGALIKSDKPKLFLFSSAYDSATVSGEIVYDIDASYADVPYYFFNMPKDTKFRRSVTVNGATATVTISQDSEGSMISTSNGVLMMEYTPDIRIGITQIQFQ